MAAATADQTLWGFVYWLKRNPHKSIETGMTWDDFDNMVNMYVTTNATDATLSSSDPLSYGATQDWPTRGSTGRGDGTGVSCTTPTSAVADQAVYPEDHWAE